MPFLDNEGTKDVTNPPTFMEVAAAGKHKDTAVIDEDSYNNVLAMYK
jgi:hypothetical protein